ncbi:MAG: methylated-DNA--[protein]-cysteine S-methyltransferase [Xanthomonadales bacterium]|nr:methylated-DNA--[protein]-cysteine S-methyltransferase [Xanthomonadales bacterium]
MTIFHTRIDSPVGPLSLAASAQGLHAIEFEHSRHPVRRDQRWQEGSHPLLARAAVQLAEYFAGQRQQFDLPLAPAGTAFQQQVWQALPDIGYGLTISYGEVARRIGRPSAVRAAAAAIGRNPLSIIVPCHRVVGANGALTGFGGGLPLKRFLLALEAGTGPD